MRARHRRFTAPVLGRSGPARPPSSGRVGGALKFVHALTAIVLFTGMVAPYISTRTAVAAPVANEPVQLTMSLAQAPNTPPPLPRPNAVVVGGDFQDQLGCDNFDKNCN